MDLKPLLKALADGEIHSGEELAAQLNVTRAAVWKKIQQLMTLGVAVEKIHAKGYRLNAPLDLLDEQLLIDSLQIQSAVATLTVPFSTASTNLLAFEQLKTHPAAREAHVVLAEHQSAGRGRRGKVWQSPVAGNLYLSVAWRYDAGIQVLSGMSVAIGVAVAQVLNKLLATNEFQLKWPNDIWWRDHKVAGILIEVQGDATSECACVIGLGVNVAPKNQWAEQMAGLRWQTLADIAKELGITVPDRNTLALKLSHAIIEVCKTYDVVGIEGYLDEFAKLDALSAREVVVDTAQGLLVGRAKGIDRQGLLCVEFDGVTQSLNAAEVSLRIQ